MKIHHIAISVKDLDKSVQFYKESFCFEEIKNFTKDNWDGEVVILKLNDFQLEIFHFNNTIEKKDDQMKLDLIGLKHIGIEVKDVDQTYERLKSNNVDIDIPQKGTTCNKFCFLKDPDGIIIELYEPKE